MKFLNKETELLLQECIDNSSNFPKVLAEKFEGISVEEDTRLRNRIKSLIDNGYFSKLQWADNVPWFGTITEDGYDYFHKKNVYIRSKLKSIPSFKLLDQQCEKVLADLCQRGDDPITVNGTAKDAKPIEQLEKLGYIKLGKSGLSYTLSGDFVGIVTVTQAGENYFKEKADYIEEILILAEEPSENSISVNMSGEQNNSKEASEKERDFKKIDLFSQEAATESNQEPKNTKQDEKSGKIQFCGILGNNCGTVIPYTGSEQQKKEKGFFVENGIPVLRGFAKISEIARGSHAQYDQYQRDRDPKHVDEIAKFLNDCKAEAKFLPEVILSVNDPSKVSLAKFNHKALNGISNTAKGVIDNLDYYILEVDEGSLIRVDGNHRLEAGAKSDFYVPFAILIWNYENDREGNVILPDNGDGNTESEAFLFYILNNTAKKLEAEENFRGLVKSRNWTDDELALINRQLPLLKYFHDKYENNPLIDKEILYAPLSQICEILVEISDPDLGTDEFDVLFIDTLKLANQSDKYQYCRENFSKILFQLSFYTRYKSNDYKTASQNLSLIDKWLENYKYTYETFTKASKLYDVAYKFISVSPKYIFMAMEYKSEQIVADYNAALSRAVHTINNMGGNIEVEAYPIMTYSGKSISITSDIYSKIDNCAIFIADTTEANPNVMYEMGIAYNRKVPIIIVREKGKKIKVPSDIISDYYYSFSGMTELEKVFAENIKEILKKDYGAVFPE